MYEPLIDERSVVCAGLSLQCRLFRQAMFPSGAKDHPSDAELASDMMLHYLKKVTPLKPNARFTCPEGDSTFSLSLEAKRAENHSIIYFEHKALDELCQSLSQKGIVFEQTPVEQSYLWKEAIIKDPSGNKIKLYWAGENRLNQPWKVEKRASL